MSTVSKKDGDARGFILVEVAEGLRECFGGRSIDCVAKLGSGQHNRPNAVLFFDGHHGLSPFLWGFVDFVMFGGKVRLCAQLFWGLAEQTHLVKNLQQKERFMCFVRFFVLYLAWVASMSSVTSVSCAWAGPPPPTTMIEQAAPSQPSPEDQAILRAVLLNAGLGKDSLRGLKVRRHLSALLPQLRMTFGRGWQLTTSRDMYIDSQAPENDRLNYAVSASWDLSKLVHPSDELSIAKEEHRRTLLRLKWQEQVARLLAERCRLQNEADSDPAKLLAIETTLWHWTQGNVALAPHKPSSCPPAMRKMPEMKPQPNEPGETQSTEPSED